MQVQSQGWNAILPQFIKKQSLFILKCSSLFPYWMWVPSEDFTEIRRYRDIPWAFYYLVVAVACLVIFGFSLQYGDPASLPPPSTTDYQSAMVGWATNEISILHHDLPIIAIALSCALVLTFVWIQVLKKASLFLISATVVALTLSALCAGVYLWNLAYRINSNLFLLLAFLCWIIAGFVVVISYLLKDKIKFTAAVMQQCGAVLQRVPSLVAVPFITSLLYTVMLGLWLLGFVYLFSIAETETVDTCGSVAYYTVFRANIRWLFLIQLLGGLWTFSLLSAFEQYVVARVVYAYQDPMPPNSGVLYRKALTEVLSTSLGSLVFGSLLSTIAEVLSLFIKYAGVRGKIKVPEFCCMQGLAGFAQYLLQWTNGFSYVYVAVRGASFGQASWATFQLFDRGLARIALASLLVNYLLAVGTLFFTFLIGGVAVAVIESYHYHIGLVSVFVTFISIYLMFHITGRLILITVNTVLVYLFEGRQPQTLETLKDIIDTRTGEETGHVVHI